jgi:hypothetical protein
MKKLEEVLEDIKKMDELLRDLERKYENEEDERKGEVILRRAERTEKHLDKLIDKADAMRENENNEVDKKTGEKFKKKEDSEKEEEEEEDEDICPSCGADLYEEEDGTLFCEKCNEYYERMDE